MKSKLNKKILNKIKNAPKEPGVYIFYGKRPKISKSHPNDPKESSLYIGKAADLRNRLKSYSRPTNPKIQSLHEEAARLEYIALRSEIEALIEESRLIKKLKPKYNILWRDDKSWLYVYFTSDAFPKIHIGHLSRTATGIRPLATGVRGALPKTLLAKPYTLNPNAIGPFTDGAALRLVMKLLRRYFPYCACKGSHLRDCLNAQIGLCLGICCKKTMPSVIASPAHPVIAIRQLAEKQSNINVRLPRYARNDEGLPRSFGARNDRKCKIAAPPTIEVGVSRDDRKKEYARNIKMIKLILRGQSKKLLKQLKNPEEKRALEKILEHRDFVNSKHENKLTIKPLDYWTVEQPKAESKSLIVQKFNNLNKIECYDISNLAGKEAVGAMTTLVKKFKVQSAKENYEWIPDKSSYRKFKIKLAPTRDDPRMIAEILKRRLNHPEWPYPDLIIIDGGLTQYRAAKAVLDKFITHNSKLIIQLISFAKPNKQIFGIDNPAPELQKLVEQAIYQTHNFVIRYHRRLRQKEFMYAKALAKGTRE